MTDTQATASIPYEPEPPREGDAAVQILRKELQDVQEHMHDLNDRKVSAEQTVRALESRIQYQDAKRASIVSALVLLQAESNA